MESAPADHAARTVRSWLSGPVITLVTGAQGRPAAIAVAVLLAVLHGVLGEQSWNLVRNGVFDTYQYVFPRQVERLPVVIIDIDEPSLAALGRWPWPRTRLAQLIEATHRLGARAVGLDIIMPEADNLSPHLLLAERQDVSPLVRDELARLPSNDTLLAQTLRRMPSVVARAGLIDSEPASAPAPGQTPVIILGETSIAHVPAYGNHLTNIPDIDVAASGRGYLNDTRDTDGVVRTMPLLLAVQGELAPALALELLRVALGVNGYSVHASRSGVRGIQVGELFIPTDLDGRIRLYFSPAYAMRRVSALSILHGTRESASLAHQVAIIGATGAGLSDVAATPVATRMDGVDIQAQVIENILGGTRLMRPPLAQWLEILAFLGMACGLMILLPRLRPGYGVLVFLAGVVITGAGSLACFCFAKWLFDPSFPTIGNIPILGVLLTGGWVATDRQRRMVRRAFQYYLHPLVVEQVSQHPELLTLGGEKRELTVLFSDIRGFSTFSEGLPPEILVQLLNDYFNAMTQAVVADDGLLDKYIGDAIMAVFGAPLPQPDHAYRACHTALHMLDALQALQPHWQERGLPVIDIGIGINSGVMVVGNMGSDFRFAYTVMGDEVNLGSRLEGVNKEYGTHIVMSEATWEHVKDRLATRELDIIRVKGKDHPTRIFELLGSLPFTPLQARLVQRFAEGLQAYRAQRWKEAIHLFQQALQEAPHDTPSQLYIQRCQEFQTTPPPNDWDGVYVMVTK